MGVTLKYLSPFLSDARGKLGNTVYSRNPYGLYTRAKTLPTQPRTALQQAGRASFAAAASAWRSQGQATIAAWNEYALTQVHRDSLGRPSHPTGFTCFVSAWRNIDLVGEGTQPPELPPVGFIRHTIPFVITQFSANAGFLTATAQTPLGWAFWERQWTLSATAPQSPGTRFFAPQLYRHLTGGIPTSFLGLEFGSLYQGLFGLPAVGSQVGFKVRWVSRFHGVAGTPTTEIYTTTRF